MRTFLYGQKKKPSSFNRSVLLAVAGVLVLICCERKLLLAG